MAIDFPPEGHFYRGNIRNLLPASLLVIVIAPFHHNQLAGQLLSFFEYSI